MDIELHGVWGRSTPTPLEPEVFTPAGWPACSTPVLRTLAGKPGAAKRALAELEGTNLSSGSEGADVILYASEAFEVLCTPLMTAC
jgi:DNA polymerase-1